MQTHGRFRIRRLSVFAKLMATLLAALASACGGTGKPATPRLVVSESTRLAIYDRSDGTFESGYLWKPAEETADGSARLMAPLLIQELDPLEGTTDPDPFGVLERDSTQGPDSGPARPTIYWFGSSIEIRGQTYPQKTYLWSYPIIPGVRDAPAAQGLRITVGSDGFPAIYEVWSDTAGVGSIFVSTALEEAASAEFGSPQSGRRFAIERSVEQRPGVVVAGVVEPGPTPLGPFVYLTRAAHDVATILCRCMPSQVAAIDKTAEYRLEEWGDAGEATPDLALLEGVLTHSDPLEQRLRLPPRLP